MRITDKRNGEPVGRVLAHPLQAKVDEIVRRQFRGREVRRNGDAIKTSSFAGINNKSYVERRLDQLGFRLDTVNSRYIYEEAVHAPIAKLKPQEGGYTVIKLKTSNDLGRQYLLNLLSNGMVISSEFLDRELRRRLTIEVSRMRKGLKLNVEQQSLKSQGDRYSIYCLRRSTLEKYVDDNIDRLAGINAVKYYLAKFKTVSSKDVGMSSDSLGQFVIELRRQGWEIEAVSRKVAKSTYTLISKP